MNMMAKKGVNTFKSMLIWWPSTLLILSILAWIGMQWSGDLSGKEAISYLPVVLRYALQNPLGWLLIGLPFLLSRALLIIRQGYRKRRWQGALRTTTWVLILPAAALYSGWSGLRWYANQPDNFAFLWDANALNASGSSMDRYAADGKHRGMHVFLRYRHMEEELDLLVQHQVEWVTLVPYGDQREAHAPTLRHGRHTDWRKRRDSSFVQQARAAHSRGLHVMMKPHIWMVGDTWRNEISMRSEADWDRWFEQYRSFILHYAELAQREEMAALCIGTELHATIKEAPERWRKLISEIKTVYKGKLVYAANWYEEFEEVSFWDELDYIGIQAYFPLEDHEGGSVAALNKAWEPHRNRIERLAKQWNRPVVFTEIGYKSTPNAAEKPWEWERMASLSPISFEMQAHCYEAFFQTFWDEPWFAGVHWWKWEGDDPRDFTPKNKPASNIMAQWFGK